MFCTTCGKEIPENSAVCPSCGVSASSEASGGQNGYSAPPVYQPPQPNQYNQYPAAPKEEDEKTKPLGIGQWVLTLIVMAIPLVGFIMMIVWAVSSTTNVNRKNYCIAALIIGVITFALFMVFLFTFGIAAMTAFSREYQHGFPREVPPGFYFN